VNGLDERLLAAARYMRNRAREGADPNQVARRAVPAAVADAQREQERERAEWDEQNDAERFDGLG
jgi:hypothetical protein